MRTEIIFHHFTIFVSLILYFVPFFPRCFLVPLFFLCTCSLLRITFYCFLKILPSNTNPLCIPLDCWILCFLCFLSRNRSFSLVFFWSVLPLIHSSPLNLFFSLDFRFQKNYLQIQFHVFLELNFSPLVFLPRNHRLTKTFCANKNILFM